MFRAVPSNITTGTAANSDKPDRKTLGKTPRVDKYWRAVNTPRLPRAAGVSLPVARSSTAEGRMFAAVMSTADARPMSDRYRTPPPPPPPK